MSALQYGLKVVVRRLLLQHMPDLSSYLSRRLGSAALRSPRKTASEEVKKLKAAGLFDGEQFFQAIADGLQDPPDDMSSVAGLLIDGLLDLPPLPSPHVDVFLERLAEETLRCLTRPNKTLVNLVLELICSEGTSCATVIKHLYGKLEARCLQAPEQDLALIRFVVEEVHLIDSLAVDAWIYSHFQKLIKDPEGYLSRTCEWFKRVWEYVQRCLSGTELMHLLQSRGGPVSLREINRQNATNLLKAIMASSPHSGMQVRSFLSNMLHQLVDAQAADELGLALVLCADLLAPEAFREFLKKELFEGNLVEAPAGWGSVVFMFFLEWGFEA